MRLLAMVLVLLGVVGVVFGVLTLMQGTQGINGQPFTFENYGGPGTIIAGLMMILGGLYLSSLNVRRG
jgi:hypothetical protein